MPPKPDLDDISSLSHTTFSRTSSCLHQQRQGKHDLSRIPTFNRTDLFVDDRQQHPVVGWLVLPVLMRIPGVVVDFLL